MLGNKEKHEAMWQHLINHVDEIFGLYNNTKDPEDDPELTLMDMKHAFIMQNYKDDKNIPFYCYACAECHNECCCCPIVHKAGQCSNHSTSAFQRILAAIANGDKELFIEEARRLKDAWE